MTLTGECLCGSITYEIAGGVKDARSCHCSRCRKAFSSQASSYAQVKAAEFSWTKGQELLSSYINEEGTGHQFCSKCGSTLCGIVEGEIHGIALGCLNEDPNIEISRHIFVGSKAAWEVIPKSVVQYNEHAPHDI